MKNTETCSIHDLTVNEIIQEIQRLDPIVIDQIERLTANTPLQTPEAERLIKLEILCSLIIDTEGRCWYKFHAYNTAPRYGYGTEDEAKKYCYHLNENREVNVFEYSIAVGGDEEYSDYWPDLSDALASIFEESEIEA